MLICEVRIMRLYMNNSTYLFSVVVLLMFIQWEVEYLKNMEISVEKKNIFFWSRFYSCKSS